MLVSTNTKPYQQQHWAVCVCVLEVTKTCMKYLLFSSGFFFPIHAVYIAANINSVVYFQHNKLHVLKWHHCIRPARAHA